MRRTFLFLCLLCLLLPACLRADHAPGYVLVKFREERFFTFWSAPRGLEAITCAALRQNPAVEFAEVDARCAPLIEPDDPLIPNQWHLRNIGLPLAWDVATGDDAILIAICDTGCDPTHPDLRYVPGWNTYDETDDTADVHGHGTMVAGVAGAIGNNAIGVTGALWRCRIVPYRTSDASGYSLYSDIAQAIFLAADRGAKVANVSVSGAAGSGSVRNAAQYLYEHGGLVFAGAGNTGGDPGYTWSSVCLAVGSTNGNNVKSSFSSYGANQALCAPGENIVTTQRGGGYGSGSGTSFSSPLAAGVAALVWAANPALSAQQVRDILFLTATDLGAPGWDEYYGYGKVDAGRAVALALNPPPPIDDIAPNGEFLSPRNGQKINRKQALKVEVSATDNVAVAGVSLTLDGSDLGTQTVAPYVWSVDGGKLSAGTHILQADMADTSGNRRSIRVSVRK